MLEKLEVPEVIHNGHDQPFSRHRHQEKVFKDHANDKWRGDGDDHCGPVFFAQHRVAPNQQPGVDTV